MNIRIVFYFALSFEDALKVCQRTTGNREMTLRKSCVSPCSSLSYLDCICFSSLLRIAGRQSDSRKNRKRCFFQEKSS